MTSKSEQGIDRFIAILDAMSEVARWPRWLRRIAVLTAPIAVPAWFIAFLVVFLVGGFCCIIADTPSGIRELWK